MTDVLGSTIADKYPDLIECFNQVLQINWDRVYSQKSKVKGASNVKRRKKASSVKKLDSKEKDFLTLQKALVVLGTFINVKEVPMDHLLNVKIDSKNYDELITNINWKNRECCLQFLSELDKLCENLFPELYELSGEWTIRKNTRRLLYELILEEMSKNDIKVDVKKLIGISEDIEKGVMMYSLLMASEICNGDLTMIDWKNGLLRSVYLAKSNSVVSSLTNVKYNIELIKMLNDDIIYAIEVAFLKRSQLLGRRFEDLETNKLRIYEESGISQGEEDYTIHNSRVRCPQCKLNHTSFTQLQTRSADEPMTIFWYCHKCKIRGRQ